jgi:hypothetical protein
MFVAWFTVAVLWFTAEFDFFERLRRGMLHHFEFCSAAIVHLSVTGVRPD